MLMSMRASTTRPARWCCGPRLQATSRTARAEAKDEQAAEDRLGLLTPVIKGVLTDQGFANAVLAQQIYGGHGYIAEHGIEQFVRDARITMLYEGTNGMQALDLVGRKLPKDGGRALQAFFAEVTAYAKERGADAAMTPYVEPLSAVARRFAARQPCGLCRTRSAIPTMPAPARLTTCISSAWSRSAICGA